MKKTLPKRNFHTVQSVATLAVDTSLFAPGDRICVAVSGGADSTALLRTLLERQSELGIVLSVLHVEHGLRGATSSRDAAFVATLAEKFHLPCEVVAVDTPKRAAEQKESIEEAARNLRYRVFRDVLSSGRVDKIATAHTLDDQAETVLMKLLRGAWTEGLSGIHPMLHLEGVANAPQSNSDGGAHQICIRPLLSVTRAQIEAYLQALGQAWCEDETNRSLVHMRNRVRHELLPILREYNPRIEHALAHMAANARAEERHWQVELARVLPQLLLPGKPVRGGGRSVATSSRSATIALEVARLQGLDPGLRRRVLRAVAEQCGATLDFETTERLLNMMASKISSTPPSHSAKRLDLPGGVRVERSARELQFARLPAEMQTGISSGKASVADSGNPSPAYELPVPGTVEAPAFGAHYIAAFETAVAAGAGIEDDPAKLLPACVRAWQPGDRVQLAHSGGPKKVKEILERMGIRGAERALWPVIVWQGGIVWMRGVKLAADVMSNGDKTASTANPRVLTLKITEIRF